MRILDSLAPGSKATYDQKWRSFATWCSSQKIDPSKAKTADLVNFLDFKRNAGLKCSTLAAYRTAISTTLKHLQGTDLADDPAVSCMVRSFKRTDAKKPNPVIPWDLNLVLNALTMKPFEPLKSISMKALTIKTLFLVALATGKRRGELHAIDRESLSHSPDWERVSLRVHPGFVHKTQVITGETFGPINISALIVNDDEPAQNTMDDD